MDSLVEIYIERAGNEIMAAESLKKLSEAKDAKEEFSLPQETTFYSSVISHSYYAIFYAAKAILLTKDLKTSSPEIHKKTYEEFKKNFVDSGVLDVQLLEIYRKIVVRSDDLLDIFKDEKRKRGDYTYQTIPQANKQYADESIKNAKTFVSNISNVIRKGKK